jgi:hypothetical protein
MDVNEDGVKDPILGRGNRGQEELLWGKTEKGATESEVTRLNRGPTSVELRSNASSSSEERPITVLVSFDLLSIPRLGEAGLAKGILETLYSPERV